MFLLGCPLVLGGVSHPITMKSRKDEKQFITVKAFYIEFKSGIILLITTYKGLTKAKKRLYFDSYRVN
jgi:hypothetical protein